MVSQEPMAAERSKKPGAIWEKTKPSPEPLGFIGEKDGADL